MKRDYNQIKNDYQTGYLAAVIFQPILMLLFYGFWSVAEYLPASWYPWPAVMKLIPVLLTSTYIVWQLKLAGFFIGDWRHFCFLRCEVCDAPISRWNGFMMRFYDTCPNCGNDNTKVADS